MIILIKESRVDKISQSLNCFLKFPKDRNNQRECILNHYPGKTEKSAFRGMVIPTLRHLGLIIGYDDKIELSANGAILAEGKKISDEFFFRILRTILYELDSTSFGIINLLHEYDNSSEIIEKISPKLKTISEKQSRERINQWMKLLIESGLIIKNGKTLSIDSEILAQVRKDINIDETKKKLFIEIFLKAYKSITVDDLGIVKISKLRERVSNRFLTGFNLILTEEQFDKILADTPHVSESYIFSFGEPMGADEKLFKFKDRYFKTVSITFFGVD